MVLAEFFEKASAGFRFRYTMVDSWGNVCSGESGIIRQKRDLRIWSFFSKNLASHLREIDKIVFIALGAIFIT